MHSIECSGPHWMGLEQTGLVEGIPARGRGVGMRPFPNHSMIVKDCVGSQVCSCFKK